MIAVMRRETQFTREKFPDQMGQINKYFPIEITWISGLVYLLLEIPRFIGEGNLFMPRYEMRDRLVNDPCSEILKELAELIPGHAINDD